MIAYLTGSLALAEGDRIVLATAGGVGYELLVPQSVLEDLPRSGETLSLWTQLVVREDSLTLYGFSSERDRAIFQRLLGTSGVGPRLALALLSGLGTRRLVRAVQERDIAALTTVPGIGKKTAERLALEMADRLKDLGSPDAEQPSTAPGHLAIEALVQLGYNRTQADAAVRATLAETSTTDVQTLIRKALQTLGSA